MGYKYSILHFKENHLEWCKVEFWEALNGDELWRVYGQAKMDCLLAGLKYREEIGLADFKESEKEYHENLEMAERTSRVSQIIDDILVELIAW
jgi:hypothetical protein